MSCLKISVRSLFFYVPALVSFLTIEAVESPLAQSGPAIRRELTRAVEKAGFEVRSFKSNEPGARHSRYPFESFEFTDPRLVELREKYHLEGVIKGASDEWTA